MVRSHSWPETAWALKPSLVGPGPQKVADRKTSSRSHMYFSGATWASHRAHQTTSHLRSQCLSQEEKTATGQPESHHSPSSSRCQGFWVHCHLIPECSCYIRFRLQEIFPTKKCMSQALNGTLPLNPKGQNAHCNQPEVKLFHGNRNNGQHRQLHKMHLVLCWHNFKRNTTANIHCPCFATGESKMVGLEQIRKQGPRAGQVTS